MRLPVKNSLPLAALMFLAGCGGSDSGGPVSTPSPNGPAADYPMVIGEPFTVGATTYTPADKLNSDEVGYASLGEGGGSAITAAHKTLPLPSYVEVTSLTSGKTILVRLERRGPLSNDLLIELSPGAAAQLGVAGSAKAPVRVRRVNPPEQERAMLRGGGQVPERMETPKPLLAVLLRKLGTSEAAPAPTSSPTPAVELAAKPSPKPSPKPAPKPAAKPATPPPAKPGPAALKPAPKPEPPAKPAAKPAATGSFTVQVAAFSTEANAKSAAGKLGGQVSKPGKFWLTRLGPFGARAEAEAALAKAKAAGYRDARIQRAD